MVKATGTSMRVPVWSSSSPTAISTCSCPASNSAITWDLVLSGSFLIDPEESVCLSSELVLPVRFLLGDLFLETLVVTLAEVPVDLLLLLFLVSALLFMLAVMSQMYHFHVLLLSPTNDVYLSSVGSNGWMVRFVADGIHIP